MSTIYIDKPTPPTGVRIKNAIKGTPHAAKNYFTHLLPIVHWLPKYNLQWLASDLVCGITVGAVIVPQSMAYGMFQFLSTSLLTNNHHPYGVLMTVPAAFVVYQLLCDKL
jgi:MFS superfamily sulfate permease-like transporter